MSAPDRIRPQLRDKVLAELVDRIREKRRLHWIATLTKPAANQNGSRGTA